MPSFTDLVDLASERLGGIVLYANDEFFAPKESLVRPDPPVYAPDRYTDRGKWMDGWESRRRRTPGHDFCVVKLGLPGRVRGVDVDTSHFTGNFPEAFSLDLAAAPDGTPLEALGTGTAPWREAVPRTPLKGDAHNLVAAAAPFRATHARLHIHPDGGVARLRLHGEVAPDWGALGAALPVDLAALENGGLVLGSSDAYFSPAQNLLMRGRPAGMHDGWETRRSRRPGFDWAVVRLGTRGRIARAVVDTSFFKGNFPDRVSLEIADAPLAAREEALAGLAWRPLLAEAPLGPDAEHVFERELLGHAPGTHVRLRIHPDGGVARLRLFGKPVRSPFVERLNAANREDALSMLTSLCGSGRFSSRVEEARPFAVDAELTRAVSDALEELSSSDWLEAFAAHPRIGDRGAAAREAAEQAAALASPATALADLAVLNEEYERRFGHVFVVCAAGLPAASVAASLRDRLGNPPDVERSVAADEQRKITRLRLAKLLSEGA